MKKSRINYLSKFNGAARYLFSGLDIDTEERERLIIALRRECAFLNADMGEEGLLIFIKDWDGNYLAVNDEMAKMYATSADKVTGRRESDLGLMTAEKAKYLLQEDREFMRKGQRQYFPGALFQNAARKALAFDVVKTPIANSNGSCCMMLFVARPAAEDKIISRNAVSQIEDTASAEDETSNNSLKKTRILILNDEYLNAILIKKVLNMEYFDVESVDNINEAADMAGQKNYDLILTNEQIFLTGHPEELSRLKNAGTKPPIIAMIKKNSEENIQKCKEAGIISYIEKPFTLSKIIEVIEKYSPPAPARRQARGFIPRRGRYKRQSGLKKQKT